MKKLIIALLVVGLLPVVAMAQYPYGTTEVSSWYWDGSAWQVSSDASSPSLTALADALLPFPWTVLVTRIGRFRLRFMPLLHSGSHGV